MKSFTMKVARVNQTKPSLGAILCSLLISLSLFAQGNFGRVFGTVTDPSGAVIASATVTVIDTQRGVARTLTTDQAGAYNAPDLIPGAYTVRVEAKGFQTINRENIVLEVGREVRVDLTPRPGEQTQSVVITDAIPLVDTASATLGGALSNAEINDLPLNGRNYQNLLGLRPGVMLQPGGSPWTQSTNNVRPDETVWLLDGVLNSNFFDNRSIANMGSPFTDMATILPVDAIQEFNLEENPKAEFGWKPGAVVNVGIKSGTNGLHGSAYAFGRDQDWDARNFFNPPPNPVLPTQLEQFGGVVGGPVKKDRLFFFGGYEGMRSQVGNAFPVTIPETAAQPIPDPVHSMADAITGLEAAGIPVSPVSLKLTGCTTGPVNCTGGYLQGAQPNSTNFVSTFPNTNVSDNYIGKMDYNLNPKNRIYGFLLTGHYHALGEDHAATNAAWGDNVVQTTWTVGTNWIWIPTSRTVNEVRFGYNRATFLFDPADAAVKPDGNGYPINTGAAIGGFPPITVGGFDIQAGQLFGSQGGRPLDSTPNPYWDIQDNFSDLVGKHALKFGGEFAHIEGDSNAHDQRGRIFFVGGGNAFPGSSTLEDFFAGLPTFGGLLTGDPNVKLTWNSIAGFVQDDWRITPKLTINMGLRYSYVTPMREVHNQIGNFLPALGVVQQGQPAVGSTVFKGDPRDFSPRLGFAWDFTGRGTTVLRGGASVIYSTFGIANFVANPGAANVPGGTSLATVPTGACSTSGYPCPQTYGGNIAVVSAQIPGNHLNWNGIVYPPGLSYCTADAPCNVGAIDPNFKNPYVVNYNLGVQHTFGTNLALEIGYVGNHGDRLTGIRDINQCAVPNDGSTCIRPFGVQYPYLQFINETVNDGRSNYNSLQTTLTKRLSHGLNFTAGYTFGHGLDNGSLNRFGTQPQNSLNPGLEYANSDYDTRHRFTLQAGYEIPGKKGFGQLLEGWKLNGIITLATGQPWVVIDSSDNFSGTSEYTDRWDFFGNPSDFMSSIETIPHCTGFGVGEMGQIVSNNVTCTATSGVSGLVTTLPSSLAAKCVAVAPDPTTLQTAGCYVSNNGRSVMVPPTNGTFGTMGRNLFRDPGFRNVDFSVFKNFAFKERYKAQFRVEFFNLLNHPNLANPYGGVVGSNIGDDPSGGTFGCGCGTPDVINGNPILGSGSARVMQLGLKFIF